MVQVNIKNLNNYELNKIAKGILKNKLSEFGYESIEKDRNLFVRSRNGNLIEIVVKSIRRPTNYLFLLKKNFNEHKKNLYLSVVIFSEGREPELFLLPASVFLKVNVLIRDRPNYKEPEFGLNLSSKNMHIFEQYRLESNIKKFEYE